MVGGGRKPTVVTKRESKTKRKRGWDGGHGGREGGMVGAREKVLRGGKSEK